MDALLYEWPWVGLAAGLIALAALVVWPRPADAPSRWRDPSWLVCLFWPVYMLHQFEEHGVDLLGRRYQFIHEMCGVLGHASLTTCPATPAFILAVNVGGGVWVPGLLAVVFRRRNVMVGACAMGIALVNAVAHVAPAIAKFAYNPGLLTALALFIPMCAWVLVQLRRAGILDGRRFAAVIASGIAVHAMLMASVIAHGRGWIGETTLVVVNVAYGLVPLAIGTLLASPRATPIASRAAA